MRGPFTSNGLELVYTGEFIGDFDSDTIADVSHKINANTRIMDAALTDIKLLKEDMAVIRGRGLIAGFLNGGVIEAPNP